MIYPIKLISKASEFFHIILNDYNMIALFILLIIIPGIIIALDIIETIKMIKNLYKIEESLKELIKRNNQN